MSHHNAHQAFHEIGKRGEIHDNKYNFIHMAGVPRDDDNKDKDDGKVVTIISKVYVTEPKTFPGPAIYVTRIPVVETLGNGPDAVTTTMNSYESAKSLINEPKTRTGGTTVGTPLSNGQIGQGKGMSGGEKAGVAFGVIAAIGLVAFLAFFCIRRRKNQFANGEKLDEKHYSQTSFFSGTAAAVGAPAGDKRASVKSFNSTHTASTAPRLSLRPVTQFLPSILERNNNSSLNVPAMSEKPRSNSPQNPFSDRAANPFDEGDGKENGTPQVGTAAAVPITTATGATRQNNVHRVQLEFKPSMDDELELKSGQLVRMVHEYDDGWALCMRMDRSQQGVCPRTCLSKLPVKPRPQGQPAQRPSGSPPGFRGPPAANAMMPRPLTPTGRERSSTAGGMSTSPSQEASRNRSQSASSFERAASPVPARKPAPGQAM